MLLAPNIFTKVGVLPSVRVKLALCAILLSLTSPSIPAQLDPAIQQLSRDIFRQFIEINTTDSIGNTTTALRQRLLAAGFPAQDIAVLGPNPRKGNMVAPLRGC